MEPRMPEQGRGREYDQQPASPEISPQPFNLPERRVEVGSEKKQDINVGETLAAPFPVLPPVVPGADYAQPIGQPTQDATYPAIANDDDLIEKEWVDQAKAIIAQTKDDPYQREKKVSLLQADYLKKRYGRTLGSSSN